MVGFHPCTYETGTTPLTLMKMHRSEPAGVDSVRTKTAVEQKAKRVLASCRVAHMACTRANK